DVYKRQVINLLVLLLGLGALVRALYGHWRAGRKRGRERRAGSDEPAAE
ncbi:hypothetical protein C487_07270, partial [Natrinema pallidum DSM 3751]